MIQVETRLTPMSNSTRRTSVVRLPPWPTGDMRIPWETLTTVMNAFGSPEMSLLMSSTEGTAIKQNTQQDIDTRPYGNLRSRTVDIAHKTCLLAFFVTVLLVGAQDRFF